LKFYVKFRFEILRDNFALKFYVTIFALKFAMDFRRKKLSVFSAINLNGKMQFLLTFLFKWKVTLF